MESLYLLIPLFFVLCLIIPLSINIRVAFNLRTYTGIVSLYLFKFRIVLMMFRLKDSNIIIQKKNKNTESEIQLSEAQKRFVKQFVIEIKDKLNIKNLSSYTRIGTFDALETSVYNGLLNAVFAIIFGYIKNQKRYAKIDILSYPAYNRSLFLITVSSKLSISFFDIIYAFFIASVITKRSEQYERI